MLIRKALPSDARGIARVRVGTWHTTYRGLLPDRVLNNQSYPQVEENLVQVLTDHQNPPVMYVAVNDADEICGFSFAGEERSGELDCQGEIYAIYVRQEYQGQNTGYRLLVATLREFQSRGWKSAMLWVLSDNPYRRFYEKHGARVIVDNTTFLLEGSEAYLSALGWDDLDGLLAEMDSLETGGDKELSDVINVIEGGVTTPKGFLAAGVEAHIKYLDRKDLALIYSKPPAQAAAVYTKNRMKAAPILVTREHLADGQLSAVVVNAGCANAGTGERGIRDARDTAAITARALGLAPRQVAMASTGVIGTYLPMDRLAAGIERAAASLSPRGGADAARAIMTTDTRPKEIAVSFQLEGKTVTIGGMAKGSGMIHPDMATLLVFITTDAAAEPDFLREALASSVDRSFNRVSVDGDTSTNDMVLLMANGEAGSPPLEGKSRELFQAALDQVTAYLAREVARDGEGATHLIEVRVQSAASEQEASIAARAVVSSSLVKSAVYGRDANWGRIICAVGYSGIEFDPEKVDVWLGKVAVAAGGCGLAFDEEQARAQLEEETVVITVHLHRGSAQAVAWGCDLTPGYIHINASYRS